MESRVGQMMESEVGSDVRHIATSDQSLAPYEYSLIGEYSRMVLLLIAVPLLIWFAQLAMRGEVAAVSLVAIAVLLVSLTYGRGIAWMRAIVVVAMTLNVLALVINPADIFTGRGISPVKAPNLILLVCLSLASLFETSALVRKSSRRSLVKAMGWSLLAVPAIAYIAGVPMATLLWETLFAKEAELVKLDPSWTMPREISFRAAKFIVFAAFTYFGACIGSFLNVVAWCVPRGKSIAIRDSCCPQCNEKIRRIDNLPIFSYVNLSAKCRNCKVSIPARYLIVELAVAAIFGSLFLYELVTGAANVPAARMLTHTGILWIILYPKWHVIAIYFFHAAFMSMILVLALIELDREKLKWPLAMLLLSTFALPAVFYMPLQPIPVPEFFSGLIGQHYSVGQPLKILLGGFVGALVAAFYTIAFSRTAVSTLISSVALAGIVLGWQSVLHVSVLFALLMLITKCIPPLRKIAKERPTVVFLIAVMIHHPVWKIVFEKFAF